MGVGAAGGGAWRTAHGAQAARAGTTSGRRTSGDWQGRRGRDRAELARPLLPWSSLARRRGESRAATGEDGVRRGQGSGRGRRKGVAGEGRRVAGEGRRAGDGIGDFFFKGNFRSGPKALSYS